jgi:hypothetical protein
MATLTQTLLWTALPKGQQDQVLQLSVYLSPRLGIDQAQSVPTLAQFPDFVTWPDLVNHLGFEVELGGVPCPARRVSRDVDGKLWSALFTADTFVRPHSFDDLTKRHFRSFPVRSVLEYLSGVYAAIAEKSPTSHPPIQGDTPAALSKLLEEIGDTNGAERLEALLRKEHVLRQDGLTDTPKMAFYQAGRFYQRPESQEAYGPIDPAKVPAPPRLPEVDFHQMVAILASYPDLLRLLGLVIDLEVDASPSKLPASGLVRVLPRWDPAHAPAWLGNTAPQPTHTDSLQKTRYLLDANRFIAEPRPGSDIENGMLRLNDTSAFDFFQVDVDGSAIKLHDFASNLKGMQAPEHKSYVTPEATGLPALRSGGFSVARVERAAQVYDGLVSAQAHNAAVEAGGEATLYADELVRGYRVDVFDNVSDRWHSLHARKGQYAFVNAGLKVDSTDEEGYIKGASVSSASDGKSADLYLHEAMFGWDGWSLSAPRPGRTIVPHQNGGRQEENLESVKNAAVTGFELQTHFRAAPGTLPLMRYGRKYQMRARVVDLAGNSRPRKIPDEGLTTTLRAFYRYEPVPPPVLVPRDVISEGESLEHMVIRSDENVTAHGYGAQPHVQEALATAPHAYHGVNERHVVPPKTSQLMAEMHGMFEAAIGPNKDYERWFNIAVKEEGTLSDTLIVDTATGKPSIPVPGLKLITPPGVQVPPGTPLPKLPLARGQALAPGQYLIHTEEQLQLPYLPDVFARGVAFQELPGDSAGETRKVSFNMKWPDAPPFRIRIEEGEGAPTEDPIGRVLTVRLPKGTIATVRYSSYLNLADLEHMGIWGLLSDTAKASLQAAAINGRHWMLTPARELKLVHAVQRPLKVPMLSVTVDPKKPGGTSASFSGHIQSHAHSTGRLAVEARWTETIDSPDKPGPESIQGAARVADFDIAYEENEARVAEMDAPAQGANAQHRMVHEFGDTKYRAVDYFSVATTRYREYFHPAITKDPGQITRSGELLTPAALNSGTGERIRLEILNSARPAAPRVLYVVPTFGWESKASSSNVLQSTRRGGGLRVFLDRPWYSSGDGELLGVVLWNGAKGAIPQKLMPLVTQWGVDPVWASAQLGTSSPLPADFKLATQTVLDATLEEPEGAGVTVNVAGHQVQYDAERKLWYSDIVLAPGAAYTPFLRLALVRLQPRSIPNAHISRVVLADFAQLAPDRSAMLQFASADPRKLHITVGEEAGTALKPNLKARRIVRVRVEVPTPGLSDELQWNKAGNEVTLSATSLNGTTVVWSGDVLLDQVPRSKGGSQAYRILIQEFEVLRTDSDVAEWVQSDAVSGTSYPVRSRLVYADALEI